MEKGKSTSIHKMATSARNDCSTKPSSNEISSQTLCDNHPMKAEGDSNKTRSQRQSPVKADANGISRLQGAVPRGMSGSSQRQSPVKSADLKVVAPRTHSKKSKKPRSISCGIVYERSSRAVQQKEQMKNTATSRSRSRRITKTEPLRCPISTCGKIMNASTLLVHFWQDHYWLQPVDAFAGQPIKVLVDPRDLKFRKIHCLGIILYRGRMNRNSPCSRGVAACNILLPKRKKNWMESLPLLVMACRTTWQCVLNATEGADTSSEPENDDDNRQILVLWVAGAPVHQSTISISMAISHPTSNLTKKTTLTPRHLEKTQDPGNFLMVDNNYMRLIIEDIYELQDPRDGKVKMTLTANEYE